MNKSLLIVALFLWASSSFAQVAFSIVAVDPETGEVGSAGASCLDMDTEGFTAAIIADVLPGVGVINSQGYWNGANQLNARAKMQEGFSPQEIMDWLADNDDENNAKVRQYGAADFDDNGAARTASFTGFECFDFKDQKVGVDYAIQGNYMLGPQILDGMEANFFNTNGSLAEKLMAAMQGAKTVGADVRCFPDGVSSRSAYLKVARPNDDINNLYLDLLIPATPQGVDPIDALQELFDGTVTTSTNDISQTTQPSVFPNPSKGQLQIRWQEAATSSFAFTIANSFGQTVVENNFQADYHTVDLADLPAGIYFWTIKNTTGQALHSNKLILLD